MATADVDFETKRLTVETKGNRKRNKKIRQLPLSNPTLALLHSLKGQHPIFVFSYVAKKSFVNPSNGRQMVKGQRYPVTPNYLRGATQRDWAQAGIDASFHDLRRTAGRQVFDATHDIRAAQHFLGHEDVKTTEIYLGVSGEREVRATIEARDDYVARMRAETSKDKSIIRLQRRQK